MKETIANLQRIFPGNNPPPYLCFSNDILPSGVRGRLVDLCKPTERKYETAVSVILGRNIDAIVVDEEKTAIDCIEYMRNQRAGQATFIPLDTIQVKPMNDKFRSFGKGVRYAFDLVQFDPAIERAIHHACGNALVCDTMELARYICYDKGQDVKGAYIVSLDTQDSDDWLMLLQLSRWRVPLSIRVVLSLVDEVRIITARSGMTKTYRVSTDTISYFGSC